MDDPLILAVQSGDKDAFAQLVDTYKSRIYGMPCRFTGSIHEGEDLAQDIFIKIYQNIKSFRGQSSLATWIYRISINRCLDWKRQYQKKEWVFSYYSTDQNIKTNTLDKISSSAPTPEEEYLSSEEFTSLHNAIQSLPEKYQKVIILYHFQELSYKDISDILDIPIRSVETQLYRAKQKLRLVLLNSKYEKDGVKNYGFAGY